MYLLMTSLSKLNDDIWNTWNAHVQQDLNIYMEHVIDILIDMTFKHIYLTLSLSK